MLDRLDCMEVDERFTRTTLEMVAVAAGKDIERWKRDALRRRRRLWLAAGAGLAAASIAGFAAVAAFRPDPNKRLLRELPMLEEVDEYHQIDNADFLRQLYEKGRRISTATPQSPGDAEFLRLFYPEAPWPRSPAMTGKRSLLPAALVLSAIAGLLAAAVVCSAHLWPDDTMARRRAQIESFSAAEREELWEHQKRFVNFSPAEQQRILRLYNELEQDPQGRQLRRVMKNYYDWLKTLPAYQQAQLHDLKPADRVERIRRMLAEQAKKARVAALAPKRGEKRQAGRRPERQTA